MGKSASSGKSSAVRITSLDGRPESSCEESGPAREESGAGPRIKPGAAPTRPPLSIPPGGHKIFPMPGTGFRKIELRRFFYADWGDSDAGIILGGGKPFSAR